MTKKRLVITIVMLLGLVALSGCLGESVKPDESNDQGNETPGEEFVLENEAFKIYEPKILEGKLVIRGLARVFEGTIQYEFEDGHYLFEEGFLTASEGGPGWGDFELVLSLEGITSDTGTVILFEESAEDGSRLHEIHIPVNLN